MVWGWYISAAAHVLLFLVVLLGGLFSRTPDAPMSVAEVQILSEAEFAALTLRNPAPPVLDTPTAAPPPEPEAAPEAPARDTPLPQITETEPPVAETPEATPDVTIPQPIPEAEAQDTAPVVNTPEPLPDGPRFDAPPARAERVAPTPAPAPPDTARIAPDAVPDVAPAPDAPPADLAEDTQEAAPDQAAPELATEAEEATESLALATSPRPRARPQQAAPSPAPDPEPEPTPAAQPRDAPATDDAVAAALADSAAEPAGDPGPTLTGGEKDNLRVAVRDCWNVGSLSTEAKNTVVTVFVSLAQDGRPDPASIRMIGFRDGSESAANQAFQAARRAIIRCGARGFPLPVEKYAQWREIEMTFNLDGVSF
ncbi:MAG: hypothetical protein AAFW64_00185 [Pseudomonadota bacterium]